MMSNPAVVLRKPKLMFLLSRLRFAAVLLTSSYPAHVSKTTKMICAAIDLTRGSLKIDVRLGRVSCETAVISSSPWTPSFRRSLLDSGHNERARSCNRALPQHRQRIGGAYCRPPLFHNAFLPRAILRGVLSPTLRSKISP